MEHLQVVIGCPSCLQTDPWRCAVPPTMVKRGKLTFKLKLGGGLRLSGRTARTIRIFSLEVSPNLVLLNIRKLDVHDFRNFLKVSSSQNIFEWAPNGAQWGPQGSPPMGSRGLPRKPSHGGSGTPSHGIPLSSQGFPLPWIPSHGTPLGSQGPPPMGSHPTSPSIFVRPDSKLTTKELTRGC